MGEAAFIADPWPKGSTCGQDAKGNQSVVGPYTELMKVLRQEGGKSYKVVHSQNLQKWRRKANTAERLSEELRHKWRCHTNCG